MACNVFRLQFGPLHIRLDTGLLTMARLRSNLTDVKITFW